MESDLLTVAEAAKWLRLGKQTVYQAVYSNRLPYYRYGSRILFPLARLQDWVSKNTIEPDPKKAKGARSFKRTGK